MSRYIISKFEQEEINKVINQIRKLEEKEKLTELEKAYYIYHELGKIYSENPEYVLTDPQLEYEKKENLYEQETKNDGKAVCIHMNRAFAEALHQIGIEAEIVRKNVKYSMTHIDTIFRTSDGKIYFANLIADIHRIQTGMKCRNFGKPYEILESGMRREGSTEYLRRIINKYGQLSDVTLETEEQMDNKFGFNYKGMYTEDVFKMLQDENQNREEIEKFFGTNKRDELIERKIDFVMDKIGIINRHLNKKIGYREGIKYYMDLQKSIFSNDEREKNMRLFSGYRIENYRKIPETIIVVLKDAENVYYRYSEEEKKFVKQENVEEIKKLDIKYDTPEEQLNLGEARKLNTIIDNLENRLEIENER